MINLLPPNYRVNIGYSRTNSLFRHWLAGVAAATVGLILIIGSGRLYINQQSNDLNHSLAATKQQLDSQNLVQVQKNATEITKNVRLINQILGREIRFSDLIQEIGKVMPPGAILGSLTLSKVDGALDLSINAKNYASAAQVAVNLSDPKNNIFDKVDINNINCSTSATTATNAAYPCSGSFKALFNKSVPSRFLSVARGSAQ